MTEKVSMGVAGQFRPVGSHNTDDDIAAADALTVPSGATMLLIQASGADCRYTLDGTTPTAAVGFTLKADAVPALILLADGVVFTIIEETTSALIDYQFGN